MRHRGFSLVVTLLCGCGAEDPSRPDQDAGWQALLDWRALPVLGTARASRSSSRDRELGETYPPIDPGNKDFNNFLAVCGDRPALLLGRDDGVPCDPGIEGYVIAAADDGPGFVSRLFLAAGAPDASTGQLRFRAGFDDETFRVYADDLSVPVVEGRVSALQDGTLEPFVPPLLMVGSEATVSYVPISYGSRLRIVLDGLHTDRFYYYEVDRRSAGATTAFSAKGLATAAPAAIDRMMAEADGTEGSSLWADAEIPVPPGESRLLLDRGGPGTLRRLRITVDDGMPLDLGALLLRASWDSGAEPALSVKLSALFACDPAPVTFETLPMQVRTSGNGAELTLTLPMPFESRATLSLENTGSVSRRVRVTAHGTGDVPGGDFGHLHAVVSERVSPTAGEHHVVIDTVGRGRYVGTILSATGHADPAAIALMQSPFNFLEGDDDALVDGVSAIQGTGTEEYFDRGWYFERGPRSAPFSAVTQVASDGTEGGITAVRWHVTSDAIDFQRSLRLAFEYGANRPETASRYMSVGLYYSRP